MITTRSVLAGLLLSVLPTFGAVSSAIAAFHPVPEQANAQAIGADARDRDGVWEVLDSVPKAVLDAEPDIRPLRYTAVTLDLDAIRGVLAQAPREGLGVQGMVMDFPMPDGTFAAFRVMEYALLPAELQAQFPDIRTYLGQGVDDPAANVRFDVTPLGFHGSIISPSGEVYIDPLSKNDTRHYASYYTKDYTRDAAKDWSCQTPHDGLPRPGFGPRGMPPGRSGSELRTYRIAVIAAAPWTSAYQNTVAGGLAGVTTVINRVNQVTEVELAVRLVLIPAQASLIFTTTAPGPYASNPTNNMSNHTYLNNTVGVANYDMGHAFGRGGDSGNAGAIGTVCRSDQKGMGWSVTEPPTGDRFAVKLVCHELGHQFGAWHTFNSCNGGQAGPQTSALEVGSGSTIMSYAGICSSAENLPINPQTSGSDPMYHSINFDTIQTYLATQTCATVSPTGNTPPQVNAGFNRAIPKDTPFTLTAMAVDADNDVLSYSWEQRDDGPPLVPGSQDNGVSPIVRVRLPIASPSRTVPILSTLLSNTSSPFERLPTFARTMDWRVVVRDGRAGGGGIATDDLALSVVATAGPFRLLTPNGGQSLTGATTVTWSVANTNLAPINTQAIRILASDDGGQTFPYVVADNVPNTGSADVILPNINTTTARLKLEAVDNYYFDLSDTNFTITFVPPGTSIISGGAATISDVAGTSNRNGAIDAGESGVGILVPLINAGATPATGLNATLISRTAAVSVIRRDAVYPELAFNVRGSGTQPFLIAVDPSHPCGQPIDLRLEFRSTGTGAGANGTIDFSVPTGTVRAPRTVTWTGRRVIPDGSLAGTLIPLNVTGLLAPITDVNAKIGGTSCSATAGSPTVGIAHGTAAQLVIALVSPAGTSVNLWDRNGATGNNLCQTAFDDSAASAVGTTVSSDAPFSNTYRPAQSLSGFNGEAPNGTWNLRIADTLTGDTGSVASVEITVRGSLAPECSAPTCPADLDNGTSSGTPDGGVDIGDLLYFVGLYEAGNIRADLDNGAGFGEPDGGVSIDDLLYYISRFDLGC